MRAKKVTIFNLLFVAQKKRVGDVGLVRDYEDKEESGAIITKGQIEVISGEEKEKCGLLQLVSLLFPMKQKK